MGQKFRIRPVPFLLELSLILGLFLTSTNMVARSNDSGHSWLMFHSDPCRTGFSTTTVPDISYLLWSFRFSNEPGFFMSSPIVADGKVYVTEPFLHCLNASTGEEIWINSTLGISTLSPAVIDDRVFVCNSSSVYCLNATTGEHIWNFATSKEFTLWNSAPAVANDKVFVGNEGGIWCLNATTGDQIWYRGYAAFGPVAINIEDDRVFVVSYSVYCLNSTTGHELWWHPLGAHIQTAPAVAYGRIFIGTYVWSNHTGILYCLNETTGDEVWNFTTGISGTTILSSPAVAYERVFVFAGTKLYCLRFDNGDMLWWRGFDQGTLSSPAVADYKVILGTFDTKVYCIDVLNGNIIWEYATGDGIDSSPALAEGKVFICSDDGYLYCFGRDMVPPIIDITYPPDTTIFNTSKVTVSGTAYDDFQVKAVKVRVNYGLWMDAVGTTSWSINVTLDFGPNIIEAQAVDVSNNPSPIVQINITLDDVKPAIHTPIQSPPRECVLPDQWVRIFVFITDDGTGVKNATLCYEINESAVWTQKPMNYNESTGLYDGEIPGQSAGTLVKYKIVAYDYAGNIEEQNNLGSYYVYTVIPEFPAIVILLFFMGTAVFSVIFAKKTSKLKKKDS